MGLVGEYAPVLCPPTLRQKLDRYLSVYAKAISNIPAGSLSALTEPPGIEENMRGSLEMRPANSASTQDLSGNSSGLRILLPCQNSQNASKPFREVTSLQRQGSLRDDYLRIRRRRRGERRRCWRVRWRGRRV